MGSYVLRAAGCGLLLMAAGPAWGQQARLYVLADSVSLGERFAVAVAVAHRGTAAVFPEVPAGDPEAGPLLAFGDAEVFEARRLPPRLEGGVRTDSLVYEAATFALDRATVGPVEVRVMAGGDTLAVATGTGVLPVRSALFSMEAAPLPPAPPEAFPGPWPLYALLGLGALALVLLAVWAFRRFRRRPPPPPPLAPYPEALRRLDALAEPATPEAVKTYYVALSDLLRRYLARTLGLPAMEQTTGELVHALRQDRRLPDAAVSAVRGTLRLCDLVKFADLRPDTDAHAAIRARTREAVESVEGAVHPPAPEEGAPTTEGGAPEPAATDHGPRTTA
jgi:hypothetical protein